MATPELEDLRAKVEQLRSLDLDTLRTRVRLISARADLEEIRDRISGETDTDPEVVMLVLHATWAARIEADLDDADAIEPDTFVAAVETGTRRILAALTEGTTSLDDEVLDVALRRTIDLGRQGVKINPTREAFEDAMRSIVQSSS